MASFTNSARFRCLEDLQKDTLALCLIYCGWEVCDPSHRYGPNQRTCHLIHIITEGRGTLEINNKLYHLKKGDMFYIPPHQEAWYEANQDKPWSYMWIGYSGIKAEECTEKAGVSLEKAARHIECVEQVYQYLESILETHQLSYENDLKRNGILMLIFSLLIKEYCSTLPEGQTPSRIYPGTVYVKHAVEYITFNYGRTIRINEVADYIGVSRSYLTNSFKKVMGCSPQKFLMNLRMEKAKPLLKDTTMSICEVAASVGYTDQLAFSKIFKQYFCVSPRAYRSEKEELIVCNKKGVYQNMRPI